MSNYIDIVYNEELRPKTDYPSKLCCYLIDRFSIKKGSTLLDAGCGRGDFLKAFSDSSLDVFGLDVVESPSSMLNGIDIRYSNISLESFILEHIRIYYC